MRVWNRIAVAAAVAMAGSTLAAASSHAARPPALGFDPSPSPTYDSVEVGSSEPATFTLRNTGGSASAALTVHLDGDSSFAVPVGGDGCTGQSLGAGKTCTVTVLYTPESAGADDSATLSATGKKIRATATLALSGTSPPAIPLSAGCQHVNDNPNTVFMPSNQPFTAGEQVSWNPSSETTATFMASVFAQDPDTGLFDVFLEFASGQGTTPAVFTVPADGFYGNGWTTYGGSGTWTMSCGR